MSYNSWARGEPNNYGKGEDCVEVNFRSPGLWNDRPCHISREFMCEIGKCYLWQVCTEVLTKMRIDVLINFSY